MISLDTLATHRRQVLEQRVLGELADISEKIEDLELFLAHPNNKTIVGEDQWDMLEMQKTIMSIYRFILVERLKRWPK